MRSINRVFLLGRLGQDVDLRASQDGRPIAKLRLATNWSRKRDDGSWEEGTDWHRVTVFGGLATTCAQHLRKGSAVFVEGRAQEREYEDRDGNRRWSHEVIAREVSFLSYDGGAPRAAVGAGPLRAGAGDPEGGGDEIASDLPF